MKKKEWLIANGHLDADKGGRGRLSAEHHRLLQEAVANGANIEGYTVSKDKSTSDKPASVVAVKPTAGNVVADIGEPTFPEVAYRAFVGGNEIGMRTVCDNCHNSLVYCRDKAPAVMYNGARAVVTFKPRNNPDWRPRWW